MKIIKENLGSNISALPDYETYFQEDDKGELRLYLDNPLNQDELNQLEHELRSAEVTLTVPITQDARMILIRFQKTISPLTTIATAVSGIVGTGLLGWQLSKEPLGVPWWIWVAAGGAVLYLIFRKPARKAAGMAIHAEKLYVTKKMLR